MGSILTSPGIERVVRRRTRRDPKPRFEPDTAGQLDAIRGFPVWQVRERHVARGVWRIVAQLDLSSIDARYSSLGRHGFQPRRLLGTRRLSRVYCLITSDGGLIPLGSEFSATL